MERFGSRSGKLPITVLLAELRGMCAGVERAVRTVESALRRFGPPIYVRHEIVHNQYVVDNLKKKGVIFVDELSEIGDTNRPVIFSAHGVEQSVVSEARSCGFTVIDATCPLVSKVHNRVKRYFKDGYFIVLIGHAGHPEVIGTMGQLPAGSVTLVETVDDVHELDVPQSQQVAYVCQTTLSVDEVSKIVAELAIRYPGVLRQVGSDVCYATTNRQYAVQVIARQVDAFVVVGAKNSSNSQRLKETAEREGCRASLVQYVEDIDWSLFTSHGVNVSRIGLTAGASTPEPLFEAVLAAISEVYEVTVRSISTVREDMVFGLPSMVLEKSLLEPTG